MNIDLVIGFLVAENTQNQKRKEKMHRERESDETQ
jgi:hypothetical protein